MHVLFVVSLAALGVAVFFWVWQPDDDDEFDSVDEFAALREALR